MEIGSQLHSRYTLTARLGKGAMGQVYRAVDAQGGQDVALKVIAHDLAFDSEMLQRFRREGEALRQLRHPNIVGFIEMFAHEGQNIIAMEYVPGGSLHDLIAKGPLPAGQARRIALEISDALTRAHHIGIIHRDLKPENVLLTAEGTPKLTDFGVARLVDEGTRLTGTGTQVGTPYYMSPEAWEGKPLDGQADIWSLGVVFYEMLTGKLPFSGDTVVAVMNQVLNAPPPDLQSQRPDTPPGLARIISRMLCRNKAERYQTMREVAADIERGDIALATPRPGVLAAPAARPAAEQTRVAPARRAAAHPAGRWQRLAWTLARLGLTAVIGLGVIGCVVLMGGGLLLSNVLEGVVTSIPFYPEEIGPGATYTFGRQDVESQLNRQAALTLPGTLSDLRLTFVPTDTLRVNAKIFGGQAALALRAEVAHGLPRVYLVSYNGLPLPIIGDTLMGGVNRGLAKVFTQDKLEMVSIDVGSEQLTLVLNGPGVARQARSTCLNNQAFSDDFGTVHGAWDLLETAEAKAYIEQGAFKLRVISMRTVLAQYLSGCSFGDAQITVEATLPTSDSYVEYGLVFNRKDAQNYHAFLVSSTGFYAFEQVTNGLRRMWPAGWTATPLLRTGPQANQLGLRVLGANATPSLNGHALPAYNVNEASWGNLGLLAASGDNIDAEVDFRHFAVAMLSEATPFPTAAPPEPTSTSIASIQATPSLTPTLTPIQQGLTAGKCNAGDVCVTDYLGIQTPLGVTKDYGSLGDTFSWSPDGWIAFTACRQDELSHPKTCPDLYRVDHQSGRVVEVYRNPASSVDEPAWSPDAQWMAIVEDGQVVVIRLADNSRRVLDASSPAVKLAWSPDSQHLAWIAKSVDGKSTLVWLIDRTGANRKLLFLDSNQPISKGQVQIAWSPDGTAVAVMDESRQAWSIRADCAPVSNRGCDGASRTSIKEVPAHWLSDFYPQWAGEK